MENITIGEIAIAVTFLVGLISGIGFLHKSLKKWIAQSLKEQLDTIEDNINMLQGKIEDVDMESCKNFLVARLSEVEHGNRLDDIETERFWEQFEHYTKKGGNSYIHRKVEQLKSEGKL